MQEKRRQEFLKSKETKKAIDAYSKQDTCTKIQMQPQSVDKKKKSLFERLKEIILGVTDNKTGNDNSDTNVENTEIPQSRDEFIKRLRNVENSEIVKKEEIKQTNIKMMEENSR